MSQSPSFISWVAFVHSPRSCNCSTNIQKPTLEYTLPMHRWMSKIPQLLHTGGSTSIFHETSSHRTRSCGQSKPWHSISLIAFISTLQMLSPGPWKYQPSQISLPRVPTVRTRSGASQTCTKCRSSALIAASRSTSKSTCQAIRPRSMQHILISSNPITANLGQNSPLSHALAS